MPRMFESARPSSSTTSAYVRMSSPMPPCSSGSAAPRNPTSASLATIAGSTASARSQSVAWGAISASQNSRAVRRISSCSGVSSKSTGGAYVGYAESMDANRHLTTTRCHARAIVAGSRVG